MAELVNKFPGGYETWQSEHSEPEASYSMNIMA